MKKILIIETSSSFIKKYRESFSEFDLIFVASHSEGEEIMKTVHIQAAIFDVLEDSLIMKSFLGLTKLQNVLSLAFSSDNSLTRKHEAFRLDVDDFIPRSESMDELKLRLESKLRKKKLAEASDCILEYDNFRLEVFKNELTDLAANRVFSLSNSETRILHELIKANQSFTTRQRFFEVLGIKNDGSVKRPIDQHICNLRKKLLKLGVLIDSKKNEGYRLSSMASKNSRI